MNLIQVPERPVQEAAEPHKLHRYIMSDAAEQKKCLMKKIQRRDFLIDDINKTLDDRMKTVAPGLFFVR